MAWPLTRGVTRSVDGGYGPDWPPNAGACYGLLGSPLDRGDLTLSQGQLA
jgi:hypothetical protein